MLNASANCRSCRKFQRKNVITAAGNVYTESFRRYTVKTVVQDGRG